MHSSWSSMDPGLFTLKPGNDAMYAALMSFFQMRPSTRWTADGRWFRWSICPDEYDGRIQELIDFLGHAVAPIDNHITKNHGQSLCAEPAA
ncbi:MAG: hypothetical protein KDC35_17115 [Acidobacteria bacterium]|nr:hypothetical protein [Acidobacteriota bacterium]